MLEDERTRWQRAEDLVRKAKEKLESHGTEKLKVEKELAEERHARSLVEAQLEETQSELSHRESELADAYSTSTALERRLEALAQNLAAAQKQGAEKDVELEGLKRSIEDAGAQIGSLRAEVDSMETLSQDVRALRASESALIKEIEAKADRVQKLETTLSEMRKELERARAESRTMAERQRLLRKAAGVLERAKKSIPEEYAAEVMAEAALQEALRPRIYTGEVEPLELSQAIDPNYQPPTAVIRQAALVANLSESLQEGDNAAPFAALMAEIQASESELASGFDDKFAAEPTTENPRVPSGVTRSAKAQAARRTYPRVGGALSAPTGRRTQDKDEEEEEGSVTEIIRLDKIE
jgi:septal ring factor EnvC (AmiA/AmiB activator)